MQLPVSLRDCRGFSFIELLVVAGVGVLIAALLVITYTLMTKFHKDTKSSSENITAKTPSMELISRYFDRWGVGVYADPERGDCSAYPPSEVKCVNVTKNTTSCDEISFWGSIHGHAIVQSVSGTTLNLISCRLSSAANQNCYYLWRSNSPLNMYDGAVVPMTVAGLTPSEADCGDRTKWLNPNYNATASSTLTFMGVPGTQTAFIGDLILRAPHRIRLYCGLNDKDLNRLWLYADLTETSAACTLNETGIPLAPVDEFKVELLPPGCDPADTTGELDCHAVKVAITFRSQTEGAQKGSYDTFKVERVFGR